MLPCFKTISKRQENPSTQSSSTPAKPVIQPVRAKEPDFSTKNSDKYTFKEDMSFIKESEKEAHNGDITVTDPEQNLEEMTNIVLEMIQEKEPSSAKELAVAEEQPLFWLPLCLITKVPSVIVSPTHYLLHIVREGITFLACTQFEMPPLLGTEFLGRVAEVLSDYVGGLNEDNIKDNFVIAYQLLDEMMDSGFPLTTELNILKEMICPPNIVNRMLSVVTGGSAVMSNTLPGATASNVPWRASNLNHSTNEVYVNLVEEMDAVVNRDGCLVKCEIFGEVHVNTRLTGVPDLILTFANPSVLNDVRFHPCVRFRPWESNKVLTFVPPDGEFILMSYRVKKLKNTPIYVRPQFSSDDGICKVNILVGMHNDPGKPIDSIAVQFSMPPSVSSSDLTANHGTINVLSNKTCTWTIGRIPKDKAPCLTGTLRLETGVSCLSQYPIILVGFKVMGIALSGLKFDKVDVKNLVSPPYKGYRAITRAASYEIRT